MLDYTEQTAAMLRSSGRAGADLAAGVPLALHHAEAFSRGVHALLGFELAILDHVVVCRRGRTFGRQCRCADVPA